MSAESLRQVLAAQGRRWADLDITATANSLAATGWTPDQLRSLLDTWPDHEVPTAANLAAAWGRITADAAKAEERRKVRPIIDQTRAAIAAARTDRRTA